MNIALQISGLLRYDQQCIQTLKTHVIDILNPDIFCSFWECDSEKIKHYRDQIAPKAFEIENWNLIRPTFNDLYKYNIYQNLVPMSYKFYRVNQLKKAYELANNINYQIVLQLRSDGIYFENFPISTIENLEIDQKILTTIIYSNNIDPFISPRMADTIYVGPNNLIDRVSQTIWYLKNQLEHNHVNNLFHHSQVPEIIQSQIWKTLSINIDKLTGSGPQNNYDWDLFSNRKLQ